MAETLFVAHVLSWDARDILVRCPFCGKTHRHGMSGNYPSRNTRVAHCPPILDLPDRYRLRFPFDNAAGVVGYWIHKQKKRFYAVGVEPEPEEISDLSDALDSQLRVHDDDEAPSTLLESGTEEETLSIANDATGEEISWTQKTITAAVSHSVLGHEGEVRQVLYTSTDAHLLVSGKGYYGDTVLSMVAAERYPRMVTLFLDHGARINSRNDQGRTPLMEAALWGRAGNVMILLARGADQEMKDRKGCKAIDFTTLSEENTEERHSRAGGVYIEDTFDADKQRKAIRRMLDSQNLTSTAPFDLSKPRTPSYDYHSFHRSSITSEVVLSAPVARSLALV